MDAITYRWCDGQRELEFQLVHVRGTRGQAYRFGEPPNERWVEVGDLFVATVPMTQALWRHVMGAELNPSRHQGPDFPLENVSWDAITHPGGFLQRINESPVAAALRSEFGVAGDLRLPSETEWEYAARGGPHWRDGFQFSGSNDVDAVAWYDRRHGDHTQPVGRKGTNQLGIHDMSGNAWEWCQDVFTRDGSAIATDGTPFAGSGEERVLRGGCFHNWAVHCTVAKRYKIAHDFHDGCIGARLVLSAADVSIPVPSAGR